MIHMEYYLVVSTIMMFAGSMDSYREITGYPDFCRVNAECYGHQLRGIQPFPVSRRTGRLLLLPVLHCHLGSRNGRGHCHHD